MEQKQFSQRGVLVTFCTTRTCCDCKTRMQVLTCMVSDIEIHNVDRESLEKQWNLQYLCIINKRQNTLKDTAKDLCAVSCVAFFFPPKPAYINLLNTEPQASNRSSALYGTSWSESQCSKSRSEAKSEWRTGRGVRQTEATNQLGVVGSGQIWWQCYMQSLQSWISHRTKTNIDEKCIEFETNFIHQPSQTHFIQFILP